MKIVRRDARVRMAAAGLATGMVLLAGCGAANESAPAGAPSGGATAPEIDVSGTIAGSGASSQRAAMDAWKAGFETLAPDATIDYAPEGSGAGRTQFIQRAVQFAGSDSALSGDQLTQAQGVCGGADNLIQIPLYVSPIAVAYNLEGVSNLQLSAATTAQIFNRQITNWNDPAIAAENPGVTLPDLAINPVHRSDDSGTTDNFTDYLATVAATDWPYEADGVWPAIEGGEAAQGTSGVVDAIGRTVGSIGYADESQIGDLGEASVQVGSTWVPPSPEGALAVVDASPRVENAGQYNFAVELDRETTAAGAYPVVLVSYTIACTQYADAAQGATVKAFLNYIAGAQGQQAASDVAGNAPISDAQRATFQPAIDAIAAAG